MAAHEVTYYQAKCDECGYVETDYGDFSAYDDASSAIDFVVDAGWFWNSEDKILCTECQRCEVCSAKGYAVDDHMLCEAHENHFDVVVQAPTRPPIVKLA